MGSNQSSHADFTQEDFHSSNSSVRGRKATSSSSSSNAKTNHVHNKEFGNDPTETTDRIDDDFLHSEGEELEVPYVVMEIDEEEDEEEEESEEEEDEEYEDEEERERILEDMKQFKILADMYLHPEKSVQADGVAFARCFFDRPSAVQVEVDDEMTHVLQDALALKTLAVDYLHPELPVKTTDPTACARCYFDRPSAPEQEDGEEERARILEDAMVLKTLAVDYLHPEMPVVTTDATIFGRNYFTRPSAPEQEDDEGEQILEDAKALKKLAVDYLHPEMPVVTTDPTVFGRNYFTRPSAPEQEDEDDEEDERAQVMADMAVLKKLAVDYLHPEKPVAVEPTAFGRNYFNRYSAPEQDDEEEREQVLADMATFKKLAVDYLHPEMPVVTTDATVFGRNYFTRPSAPEQEEDEEEREQVMADMATLKKLAVDYLHPEMSVVVDPASFGRNYFTRPSALQVQDDEDERAQVLEEMAALKKLAVDYLHPEKPVNVDSTAFGRNYFTRPSAPEMQDDEEREQVLADMAALKKLAVDYLHPEMPVVTTDPAAFGRNYFMRASAPEFDDGKECAQVLADMVALKKLAVDYLHPELPVAVEATASGRNYFTRPSAPEVEDEEERAQVLADMGALKKLAVDYLHPELPVAVEATAFGRNYFTRPSAPEVEDEEEREQVLADMGALKKLAVDYLHPEFPVAIEATAFGRNFFTRASATEVDDDVEERAQVLADMAALKKLAVDYLHPELPVAVEATAFGRNYFTRASAPDVDEDDEERAQVLADVATLKKLAVDYLHPELQVAVEATAFGRNYFTRPSAPEQDDEGREQVLADMAALKKLAVDYLHPEMPVATTDYAVFGRNYFTRPSAPQVEDQEVHEQVLADMAALKKLAVDYAHPELPVVTTDPTVFGRNYFTRASAPEVDDDEERAQVLSDVASLKKLAVDYLHPEMPVVTTDPTTFGRNYFTRPSAPQAEDQEEREEVMADVGALKKLAVDYAHPELPVVTTDPTVFGRNYFTRPSAPAQESSDEGEERKVSLEEANRLKKSAVDYAHPELPCETTDPTAKGRNYFNRPSAPGHAEHISSSGYDNNAAPAAKQESQEHYDYDHYDMEEHHEEHHDQFEMDEDIWSNMYTSLHLPGEVALKGGAGDDHNKMTKSQDEEEEGKLSRSPSSVMLFEQGGMEGY